MVAKSTSTNAPANPTSPSTASRSSTWASGRMRPGPRARPVLPGVLVPAPGRQLEVGIDADLEQGDVQAGDRRGVTQEQRVGGALPRSWRGPLDQASAGPGEPPVEWGGARRRAGAGALHERAATQPDEAVVHGPLRTLGQCDELRRGEHPVGVQ